MSRSATTTTSKRRRVVRKTGSSRSAVRGLNICYFAMLTLFLVCLSAAGVSTYEGWRSFGFREVDGEIVDRGVNRISRQPGSTSKSTNPSYYLRVAYVYEVDGLTYRGDRIQPGTFGFANGADFKQFGNRFGVGDRVPVYVDPQDHSNAVLERGYANMMTMFWALAGFFGFAVLMLGAFRRAFREGAPRAAKAPPRWGRPGAAAARTGRARPLP